MRSDSSFSKALVCAPEGRPGGAIALSPGFQPWKLSNLVFRPERATDHVDQPHACSQPNLTSSAAPSNKSAPLQHVVSRIEISGFCLAINDYRGGEYRSFTSDVELDHCTIYVCYSNAAPSAPPTRRTGCFSNKALLGNAL
jgi:hypothetical protein